MLRALPKTYQCESTSEFIALIQKTDLQDRIERLFASNGDLQFIRAKMALAESAGQLDMALAQAYESEEIEKGRRELSKTIQDFTEKHGAKITLGVDLKKPDEIDRFATALIEYGMIHRVR